MEEIVGYMAESIGLHDSSVGLQSGVLGYIVGCWITWWGVGLHGGVFCYVGLCIIYQYISVVNTDDKYDINH